MMILINKQSDYYFNSRLIFYGIEKIECKDCLKRIPVRHDST